MFNGNQLRDAIISGAHNIINCKQQVDELNVFPVPDGDTGTNMSMTIGNAAKELEALPDTVTATKTADTTASAMLRGARGNSGVILSLLFRGFSKGLKGDETLTSDGLAKALELGVAAAYKAVMKPTEGTILTVARFASEAARASADAGDDCLTVFEKALENANVALNQTPELLPVLKKAGVVDAGGKGFTVVLEGMLSVLKNGTLIALNGEDEKVAEQKPSSAAGAAEADITFTYCTEFIVKREADMKDPKILRAYLESIGDCVVVVDDDEIIKVHVHTNHPGKALEKALTFGQLINMKVENMRDQHEKAKHDNETEEVTTSEEKTEEIVSAEIEKDIGFVCIAAGDGIEGLFKDLGADIVVSGGQTMNPSTDDILKAIEATPASTVYVLPNNKNIIMAAEQTVELSSRKVIVLTTKTIPQGISAMLNFDPELDEKERTKVMCDAASKVQTGQITFAARDSDFDGHKIKQGELLALANGKIDFVEEDLTKCAAKLTKTLCSKNTEFITLIYGEDVTEQQAEEALAAIKEKVGDGIEVTLVNGGQPVYYFIISVE